MKKWFISIVLSTFVLKMFAIYANADGITYWVENGEAKLEWVSVPEKLCGHFSIPAYISYYENGVHNRVAKVTRLGGNAFQWCVNLTSVSIPNTIREVGGFSGCSNLKDVSFSHSVTSIADGAFGGCSSLTSISIPNTVTSIGQSAFAGCTSLTNITIPNSVTFLGDWCFKGCVNLTNINIPESVTSIGYGVFAQCSSLTSISIPNSVSFIPGRFNGCSKLSTVVLGNSVKEIGVMAFYDIPNITIYCNTLIPPTLCLGNSVDLPSFKNYDATLVVPKEAEVLYREAKGWKNFFITDKLKIEAYSDFYGTLAQERRYEAKGVTADGESKLIVYVDDDKDFSEFSAPEIRIKLHGGEKCTDEKITGTIGSWQKQDNGKWGFVYTAPQDYIGIGKSFLLDIEVIGENNSLTACGQIEVFRPGVLFLHGFISSQECFKYIYDKLLLNGNYTEAQLLNGDYKDSNMASFHDNTYNNKVVQRHLEQMCRQLAGKGIVSSKYDLVGHSMGGILSRLYAQEVNKGAVNRIITINTPHYGSNISVMFRRLSNYSWGNNHELIGGIIDLGLSGAGNDLAPNSFATQNLNSKRAEVPVHALCSVMTGDDFDDYLGFEYVDQVSGLTELYLNLGYANVNSFHDVLNAELGSTQHDGVVTLESQLGGLTRNNTTMEEAPYRGVLGKKSDAHHINTCRWDETFNNISSLLLLPKSSNKFCATGFPTTDMAVLQSKVHANGKDDDIEFVEPIDSSYIKIKIEVSDDSIKTANVTVDKSGDIAAYSVFSVIDDCRMLIGSNKDTLWFALPEDYSGDLTFYAMGRTSYNALVCDSTTIELTNDLTMNYLYYQNRDTLYLSVGQSVSPAVIVGWSNGQEKYFSPEFTTDDSSILQINSDIITAILAGHCRLKASAGEISDSIHVRVIENPSIITGIDDTKKEGLKMYNRQDELVLKFGEDYVGNLDVLFCQIDGKIIKQVHRNVNINCGEQLSIDLSDFPKQLYIVGIRLKNNVIGYKMLLK